MPEFPTVIFDFDYTLADSSQGVVGCITYALAALGLPAASDQEARRTIGLSLTNTFVHLTGRQPGEQSAAFEQLFIERAEEVMVDGTVLFATVPGTIERLTRCGIAVGIVSTKFRRRIKETLERDGMDGRFPVIVGGEDVAAHKPDPEGLLAAIERLGGSLDRTLYVGDSVIDAETAKRAQVRFAAVLSGMTPEEDFVPYAPWAVLRDLVLLPDSLGC